MNDAVNLDTQSASEPQSLDAALALNYDGWLEAIISVARHNRLDCSAQTVRIAAQWSTGVDLDLVLRQMARQAGVLPSRLAHGVPLGGELEYVDRGTLAHAFGSRTEIPS